MSEKLVLSASVRNHTKTLRRGAMPDLEGEKFGRSHADDSDAIVINRNKEDIDAHVGNSIDNDSIKDGSTELDLNHNATIGCDLTTKDINNKEASRTVSDDVTNNDSADETIICDSDDVTVGEDNNTNEDTAAGSEEDDTDSDGNGDDSGSITSEEMEECEVCLMTVGLSSIHKRPCCHLQVCIDCMKTYVATTVDRGVIHVQCPGNGCGVLVADYSVLAWLVHDVRVAYVRRSRDGAKACPRCSHLHNLVKEELKAGGGQERQKWYHRLRKKTTGRIKRSDSDDSSKGQRGEVKEEQRVMCEQCSFVWCYPCHAPWHEGMTCAAWLRAESKQFKKWTQQLDENQRQLNARQCPHCKVYISRTIGCRNMTCSRCSTAFCYDCGEMLYKNRGNSCKNFRCVAKVTRFFIGTHESRLAPRGCTHNLLPNSKALRRTARGGIFVGKILAAITLFGPVVALGAGALVVVVGVGVVAVPVHQCVKVVQKRRKAAKREKNNATRDRGICSLDQSAMAIAPPAP